MHKIILNNAHSNNECFFFVNMFLECILLLGLGDKNMK